MNVVAKNDVPITVPDVTIVVDENATVVVTVPEALNGQNVTITVNGKSEVVKVNASGKANATFVGLANGTYEVIVSYAGDDYYYANSTNASVFVNKLVPEVTVINVTAVVVDHDAVINITGPADRTGKLVVNVDGVNYAVNMTNGNASLTVKGLTVGNKTVTVTYLENDKYVEASASGWVNVVAKVVPDISVTVNETEGTAVIELPADATGNVTVKIDGVEYDVIDITETPITVDIGDLMPGEHTIEVIYSGDYNYTSASDMELFKVPKVDDYNITVDTKVDENSVDITVTLPENVTGPVLIDVDGVGYYANVTAGQAKLHLDNLTKGDHDVVVRYPGDDYYAPNGNATSFTIDEKETQMKVEVEDGKIVIELPEDATGEVTVTIDGENQTVPVVNGKAVVDISDLEPGNHTVDVNYPGDDKYAPASDSITVDVPKIVDYPFDVTEKDGKIIIDVPDDATGEVTVTIDGVNQTVPIVDGKAVVDISDLEPGNHTVDVNYPGDDKYAPASDSITVDVPKIVDYPFDVTEKDGKIIIDVPDDATGEVTVTIDGVNQTVPIVDGKAVVDISDLEPGKHAVEVTYPGDDKYAPASDSSVIDIPKVVDYPFDVTEEDGKIVVDVPDDATGYVTVTIDGKDYVVPIKDGKAVMDLPSDLGPGNHTVDVSYPGDDKYAPTTDSTTVDVPKVDITQEDGKLIIDVPDDATGNVTVTIDGVNQTVPIVDGKAVVDISDLEPGNHTVDVSYPGDDNYAPVTESTVIEVPKETDYPFTVSEEDGKIVVDVPDDATGYVTVTIDGKDYAAPIKDGKAVIDVPSDLEPGNHTVDVSYPGDDKYAPATNSTTIEVPKETDYPFIVTEEDGKIVINVPEDATGNVTVTIDGEEYDVPIVDGKAVVDIPSNLEPGNHTVNVTYSGDDKYAPVTETTIIEVPKAVDYPIDVTEEDGKLVVDVPDDATGDVTVTIDGKDYVAPIKDGKAVVDISDLEPGKHAVEVTYPGDDKYAPASNSTVIDIPKESDYPFDVTAEDINVGEKTNITINLPEDVNGPVLVDIDGIGYYANVTDGVAHVELPLNLKPGTYEVVVTFPGNDKYEGKSVRDSFTVDSGETPMDVKVEDGKVIVELPEDATGDVTVTIDGKNYTVPIKDGKAVMDLPSDLEPGKHTVDVNYPGDDKYAPASDSTTVDIPKETDYPFTVTEEDGKIVVDVPDDATGDVTVTIDGKDYVVPIKDGKAVMDLPSDLEPGEHTVDVSYPGNDKYAPISNSTTVDVPKIDITNTDNQLVVDVPDDATGDVTVTIDGKDYTVPIKDGKAVVDISDLPAGEHNVKVTYPGDDKYAPRTVETTINKTSDLIITAPDVVKYYSGPERFIIYFKDSDGNNVDGLTVKITINGVTYERTSKDGQASLGLNLNSGNYTVKVEFAGTGEYKPETLNANVEILPTIYAKDVLKVFRNGTQYYALFLDGEGNPLVNTDVSFNIHGVFYTRTTNASGWAKLNINLEQGKYILTAMNPVTGEMRSNNVTVFTLIESSDLVKYNRNGTQFVIRVRGEDGNWAKAGESVTFNINGVFYTRYTNETGHIKLNINLEPGKYVITSYYKDCVEGNTVTVLPRLITSDLTMKYGDGSKFIVKTLDEKGNSAPGQEVSFNVNGLLYTRTTNSTGEAGISINLQPGEYLMTSTYLFETHANTIKIEA